ncbi:GAF domain-containing protein [Pendulispora albinea]|uniref:GAF domain-containing protein n=1 Tax=Pendulispora albinea TaxID=2741071 RepID=A0ABZ2LKY0_9BACT
MGKRLLLPRTKKKTSTPSAVPRPDSPVAVTTAVPASARTAPRAPRPTLVSAPVIELDPDVDIHPEDWVTHVDPNPFALTHDGPEPFAFARDAETASSSFDDIDDLFQTVRDLPFCETTAEAASFCLAAVLRFSPARIGLVHVYDAETRQFVVVYAQGPDTDDALMMRTHEDDPLIQSTLRDDAPRSWHYDEHTTDARPRNRHAFFGPVRSVLVAPVAHRKRPLGVIELIDPLDGSFFDARAENTLSYVAGRLGEHLASRGTTIGHIVAPSLESGDYPAARPMDMCRVASR